MKFQVLYPGGYNVDDIENDNIDINVVTKDGDVYFATIFTCANITTLMQKENSVHFWSVDMIIVNDLKAETIVSAIQGLIDNDHFMSALCYIGKASEILPSFRP